MPTLNQGLGRLSTLILAIFREVHLAYYRTCAAHQHASSQHPLPVHRLVAGVLGVNHFKAALSLVLAFFSYHFCDLSALCSLHAANLCRMTPEQGWAHEGFDQNIEHAHPWK